MKNTNFTILVIILSLGVLGLGGFIVYDKFLKEETVEKIEDNNPIDNIENNDSTNNAEDEIIINNDTTNNEIIKDNSYDLFAKNFKNYISKYDSYNRSYQYVKNNTIPDGYEIYMNENGSLFVKYFNKELNTKYGDYKIADNVLSFYVIAYGQGGGNMLFFINEDGTVGSANTEYGIVNDNKITIKKDLGYKNIVCIVSKTVGNEYTGSYQPIFIDINGNIFN